MITEEQLRNMILASKEVNSSSVCLHTFNFILHSQPEEAQHALTVCQNCLDFAEVIYSCIDCSKVPPASGTYAYTMYAYVW